MTIDTPETVAEKMAAVKAMMGPFMHYISNNHPGDWQDCQVEDCYNGELEGTDNRKSGNK